MGNSGELNSGELQWMTAGSGIIHSEMPLQKNGLMKGFQLWVNLPAREKMQSPKYKDIRSNEMVNVREGTTKVKILAGNYKNYSGPIKGLTTMLEFYDIEIGADKFTFEGSKSKNYFIYVFEGSIKIGGITLDARNGVSFSETAVISTNTQGRILLIGGRPLNEPIFQYGPFVMNTKEEISQAIKDFQLN